MSSGIGLRADPSPLTSLRLCHTALVLPDDPSRDEHARHYATVARAIAYLRALAARQPQALLARDDVQARDLLARVPGHAHARHVHLVLRGTNFQIQVWQAMLRTRAGQVLSYTDVAQAVGARRLPEPGTSLGLAPAVDRLSPLAGAQS